MLRPLLYGIPMRLSLVHLLIALLIAVFAIGAPIPVQASCAQCDDCTIEAPANSKAPCGERGLACTPGLNCATQLQKMPSQTGIGPTSDVAKVAFGWSAHDAINSAFVTPETAPPRL